MDVSEQTVDASASNGDGGWRCSDVARNLSLDVTRPDGAQKDGWRKSVIMNFVFQR